MSVSSALPLGMVIVTARLWSFSKSGFPCASMRIWWLLSASPVEIGEGQKFKCFHKYIPLPAATW